MTYRTYLSVDCEQNKVDVQVLLREDDEQLRRFFSILAFRRGNMVNFVREYRADK
jgi:hypothetical protein